MPRSRWETHIEPFLTEIAGWARDGVIDEDIAKRLGVAYSTFRKYVNEKPELAAVVKANKERVDREVEEGLIRKAKGCIIRDVVKEPYIDPLTGHRAVDDEGNLRLRVTRVIEREMAPDTKAAIFWLKNRMPDKYRDKHELSHSDADKARKLEDLL